MGLLFDFGIYFVMDNIYVVLHKQMRLPQNFDYLQKVLIKNILD